MTPGRGRDAEIRRPWRQPDAVRSINGRAHSLDCFDGRSDCRADAFFILGARFRPRLLFFVASAPSITRRRGKGSPIASKETRTSSMMQRRDGTPLGRCTESIAVCLPFCIAPPDAHCVSVCVDNEKRMKNKPATTAAKPRLCSSFSFYWPD